MDFHKRFASIVLIALLLALVPMAALAYEMKIDLTGSIQTYDNAKLEHVYLYTKTTHANVDNVGWVLSTADPSVSCWEITADNSSTPRKFSYHFYSTQHSPTGSGQDVVVTKGSTNSKSSIQYVILAIDENGIQYISADETGRTNFTYWREVEHGRVERACSEKRY